MSQGQLELFALPNPCVNVCESNSRGYCKGCLRSRTERFNWHQKPQAEQAEILERLKQRRHRLQLKQQQLIALAAQQPNATADQQSLWLPGIQPDDFDPAL